MTEDRFASAGPAQDDKFGVLVVRRLGHAIDSSFGYLSDRLPEIGDVIDVTDATGNALRVRVNGVEKRKTFPIRAAEFDETPARNDDHPP